MKKRNVLWNIVRSYITRWRIGETFRFIEQSYNLEDLRVPTYRRPGNLVAFVSAAGCFAAVYGGERLKLRIMAGKVSTAAKRFSGIPLYENAALRSFSCFVVPPAIGGGMRVRFIMMLSQVESQRVPAHATVRPPGAHKKPIIGSPQLVLFGGSITRKNRGTSSLFSA